MPTISMFYGIIIRMYYAPKEHNPPHFHVYFQDFKAIFDIHNGELADGELPFRQIKLVEAWIEIHRDELLANWELCQSGEMPVKIKPLK